MPFMHLQLSVPLAATEINQHISVLPLPLAPDIQHDGQQDDASQRHEMCQLKRQPIQVVVLQIHIARDQQEIAGNAHIQPSARASRSRLPPVLLAPDTCEALLGYL